MYEWLGFMESYGSDGQVDERPVCWILAAVDIAKNRNMSRWRKEESESDSSVLKIRSRDGVASRWQQKEGHLMVKSQGKNSKESGEGKMNDLEMIVAVCEEFFLVVQRQSYLWLSV